MNINGTDALSIAKSLTSTTQTSTANTSSQRKGLDQNSFLTLLVEQLKHQDPLAPQDGAQFVAQLAQFNSLEQLISINQRLGQLTSQNRDK